MDIKPDIGRDFFQKSLMDFLVRITRADENQTIHWGYYDAVALAETELAHDDTSGQLVQVPKALVPVHQLKISRQLKESLVDWKRYEVFNCVYNYIKGRETPILDKKAEIKKGDIIQYQLEDGIKLMEEIHLVYPNLPYPCKPKKLIQALQYQEKIKMAKVFTLVIRETRGDVETSDDRTDLLKTGGMQQVLDEGKDQSSE